MIHVVIAAVLLAPAPAAPPFGGYTSCTQAAADGRTDIPKGDPGYRASLDRDNDGVACETAN